MRGPVERELFILEGRLKQALVALRWLRAEIERPEGESGTLKRTRSRGALEKREQTDETGDRQVPLPF